MAMIGLAAPKVSFNILGSPIWRACAAVPSGAGLRLSSRHAGAIRLWPSGRGELGEDGLGLPDDAPEALAGRTDVFDEAADLAGERRHGLEVAGHVPQGRVRAELVDGPLLLMADDVARKIVGSMTPAIVAVGFRDAVRQGPHGRAR